MIPVVAGSNPVGHPKFPSVAQWIVALAYEAGGWEFESLQAGHNINLTSSKER